MGKNIINGVTIEGNHKSISIVNGKIYLDGKLYDPNKDGESGCRYDGPIVINGNVGSVEGTQITINGDVHGDVDGTRIDISGSVTGDVDGTRVTIGSKK